jgi:enoyl-CoA hydratase/carnithine racemase
MRIIKEQVRQSYFQDLASATHLADREQANCANSEDLKEGVTSFIERRSPNFTGR